MNILFLLAGKSSSDHMNDGFKISTCRTALYIIRLLRKQGHRAVCHTRNIEEVDYGYLDFFKPDIVCLPAKPDEKLIEWAKNSGAKIGMGIGEFHSKSANSCMNKYQYLDFIVFGGEPYNTWVELAKSIESGKGFKDIKGLVYRNGSEIIENAGSCDFDINDFNDLEVALPGNNDAATITTSLGCVGNCTFCSEKLFHKKWQGRDVNKVIEEIKKYTDNGHYHFEFADTAIESPDIKLERLTKLCKGIIALNKPIFYKALFRPDFSRKATTEIMDLLVKSGLYYAFIGVESGNDEDLKLFNKRCTVQEAKDTVRLFEKYGVHTGIGFIMFHPFSTIESLTANIDLLDDLGKADFNTIFTFYRSNEIDRLTSITKKEGLYYENGYTWRFKDDKVSQIFTFIRFYFETMRPILDEYDKLLRLQGWYHHLEKKYAEDSEKSDALKAYFKRTESIKQAMSIRICIWFRKLLEIAKEGFNNEKAVSVSLSLLNEEMITETTNYINCEKKKLEKILGMSE
jgi:radical SAM superfamily enzyme YgiQ (UPF0313 family)